jgi:hypothetical protein
LNKSHIFCLIGNSHKALFAIHKAASRYLKQNYKVIYAAEEKSRGEILNELLRAGSDNRYYEGQGSLVISKPSKLVTEVGSGRHSFLSAGFHEKSRPKFTTYRTGGTKGSVIFCSPNSQDTFGPQEIRSYEKTIKETLSQESTHVICCYRASDFQRLSFADIVSLIREHDYIVYSEWDLWKWLDATILEMIEKKMDELLGAGSAQLIFKTLQLVYAIKDVENLILNRPEVFNSILRKILGESTADLVDASIKSSLLELISYDSTQSNRLVRLSHKYFGMPEHEQDRQNFHLRRKLIGNGLPCN